MMRDSLWFETETRQIGSLKDIHAVADTVDIPETSLFIRSGLRAAHGAKPAHRLNILKDLSSVLNCSPEELTFMFTDPFMAANDSEPVAMPDFRATIQSALR